MTGVAYLTSALNGRESDGHHDLTEKHGENAALPRSLRAEVNFLRLPLFALHTKGLKNLDGIECRGRITRAAEVHQYLLRISRNTGCRYPGPLSRKVHHALLSIATERGLPLKNPIEWQWRDLCRRMGIAYGGQTTVRQLKDAIRSTHGIVIHSRHALYNKSTGEPLPARERGYHLYSDYAFVNEPLAEGKVADHNAVWFADWYLENLNAFYTAPLDYRLWQSLENRSPTASRLYEFLLLNFHGSGDVLRINYPRLAKLLPVRAERYLSDAQRQLSPAFEILITTGVLGRVQWTEAKDGTPQLILRQGSRLKRERETSGSGTSSDAGEMAGLEVNEIRNEKPPEWFLVTEFYKAWSDERLHQPTAKELEQAREMISRHGQTQVRSLMPALIKTLREKWPDAKTFGAVPRYLPEVLAGQEKKRMRAERERVERDREAEERKASTALREERKAFRARWLPEWRLLTEQERERIRRVVLVKAPRIERVPKLLERFCLEELARQRPEDG